MGYWHFLTMSLCFFLCLLSQIIYVSSLPLPTISDNHNTIHGPKVKFDPTLVTQVSWHPRAFLYKGFLSDKECDHLINKSRNKLEKSAVADIKTGKSMFDKVRTSSGMFFTKAEDEIIAEIETRIATWTFFPINNGEPIQVLRYERGQKYDAHFDYFHDKFNQQFGGHRMATVLMYLSNVDKGGETVFPNSEIKLSQPKDDTWSECGKGGYAVKPKKGDALLFFSLHPNATEDIRSLHQSCPVIEGEKWSATKWIHVGDFDNAFKRIYREGCVDENDYCSIWAELGECERNSLYMVGKGEINGHCMKSCNAC